MRILIANTYSIRGGIPKFAVSLANAMAKKGHKAVIFTPRPIHPLLYPAYRIGRWLAMNSKPNSRSMPVQQGAQKLHELYDLADGVELRNYRLNDKNQNLQALRANIKALNFDVCVGPMADGSHLLWAIALLGSGVPYIYSERTSPRNIENLFWNRKGRLAAMSGSDAIHLLMRSYEQSVPDFLKKRVQIIPNAVNLPASIANTNPPGRKILLWVGRLHEELKQCRMAIEAFAIAARKRPDWKMLVVGSGPDEGKIKAHAKYLKLGDRIEFIGECGDVQRLYTSSQAFCFSSAREGMPNALMEAMASGLPCAAFAQCDGVEELLPDADAGLLAWEMSPKALALKLEILMDDANLRKRLGANARKRMAAYSESVVFDAWERLILQTAAKKGQTVMDGFAKEPFASMARLASRARQECAGRNFGDPPPGSLRGLLRAAKNRIRASAIRMHKKIEPLLP